MARLVLDASALMAALLPGEPQKQPAREVLRRAVTGNIELAAPTLFPYEVANSLLKAERAKGREVEPAAIDALLRRIEELAIDLVPIPPTRTVQAARVYGCWGYDAAYLALAEEIGAPLVTADKRLFNSVRSRFSQIQLLGG